MFHVEHPDFLAHPKTTKADVLPIQVYPNVPRGTPYLSRTKRWTGVSIRIFG